MITRSQLEKYFKKECLFARIAIAKDINKPDNEYKSIKYINVI
jgi:hypothetical protein